MDFHNSLIMSSLQVSPMGGDLEGAKMKQFTPIRQQLHRIAELSGQEVKTSAFVVDTLQKFGVTELYTNFAQHAVLAVIRGQTQGKTILFRSELDALPIVEANNFEHRSQHDSISHKCGHDGHTATLLAVAQHFVENPPLRGVILLLFQSAEEIGTGAQSVIDSRILEKFEIDYAFAYHNLPGYPFGLAMCKTGLFTRSVESFNVTFWGKECHASEPQNGINPAIAVSDLIQFMSKTQVLDKNKANFCIATPIQIQMGSQNFGISAGHAVVGYTLRTGVAQELERIKSQVIQEIQTIGTTHNLTFKIEWFDRFYANNNASLAVEQVQNACYALDYEYQERQHSFDFGEDFGLMTEHFPGAMFCLGAGEDTPSLHTIYYDFPDGLLPIAKNIFQQLVEQIL